MAKIGTAHLEIKPVVDEAALEAITARIAEAVAEGVRRGMTVDLSRAVVLQNSTGVHVSGVAAVGAKPKAQT